MQLASGSRRAVAGARPKVAGFAAFDHQVRANMQTFCEGTLRYSDVAPAPDKSAKVVFEVRNDFTRPPAGAEAHKRALLALTGLQARVAAALGDFHAEFGTKALGG